MIHEDLPTLIDSPCLHQSKATLLVKQEMNFFLFAFLYTLYMEHFLHPCYQVIYFKHDDIVLTYVGQVSPTHHDLVGEYNHPHRSKTWGLALQLAQRHSMGHLGGFGKALPTAAQCRLSSPYIYSPTARGTHPLNKAD